MIAISAHTEANFGGGRVEVVHNRRTLIGSLRMARSPRSPARGPLLGVAGQITPWKGQDDAIRALAL